MIATQDAQELLPDVYGRKHLQTLHKPGKGVRFIIVTLPFHALSAGFAMIMTVFGGGIFVPGRSTRIHYGVTIVLTPSRRLRPPCSPA